MSAARTLTAALVLVAILSLSARGDSTPSRRAVLAALKVNDATERAAALETALADADSAAAVRLVLDVVVPRARSERDLLVAGHTLGQMRDSEAVAALARRAQREAPLLVRTIALAALGRSEAAGASPALRAVSRDAEDARLRAAAVTALGRRHEERQDLVLAEALRDPDWRVRSAGIWGLARQGRTASVPLLTDALRGATGRLVDDCAAALAALTGERFGPDPARYEAWWREAEGVARPTVAPPEWEPPPANLSTSLLALRTDRVLIALSTGESMKDEVPARELGTRERSRLMGLGSDLVDELESARTKMDVARVHVRALIRSLRDGTRFDVAAYSGSPAFAFGEYVAADRGSRKRAETRIARLSPGGGGNLSELLRRAYDPRGKDPLGAAGGPDTIVLISDGRLAAPGATDRLEVTSAVARWNRVRQVRVVVLACGISDTAVLAPLAGGPPQGELLRIP